MTRYLVTLHLLPGENTLEYVRELRGLKELKIDEEYGLVLISPTRNLYTIRVSGDIDSDELMSVQPKVKGVYGDVRIAPIGTTRPNMELQEKHSGVDGLTRPFKEFIMKEELVEGNQIVYYGRPGLGVPFILALSFALRDLPAQQVFVPYLNESKAKVIEFVPDVGMQVSKAKTEVHPKVVVLMGSLTMPDLQISAEMVNDTISRYEAKIIGACYMGVFFTEKWVDMIAFDLLIDGIINPVYVWRKK